MLQYHPLIVRSKASLGSSREVEHGCGVSFVNCLYLVPLIIDQKFCATCGTSNQTGPRLLYPASPAERVRRELSEPEKEEKYSRRGRAPRCSSAASLRRLAATARSQSRPHLPDCLFPAFGAALCMARNGPESALSGDHFSGAV